MTRVVSAFKMRVNESKWERPTSRGTCEAPRSLKPDTALVFATQSAVLLLFENRAARAHHFSLAFLTSLESDENLADQAGIAVVSNVVWTLAGLLIVPESTIEPVIVPALLKSRPRLG